MKIKIITTGGTIDKIYFDKKSAFEVGAPQIDDVLQEASVIFDYEITSLMRKDSLDLSDQDRQLIRDTIEADPDRLFLVTHGTDTMVQTAKALEGLHDKVIVLTGSTAPARFRVTDAVFNIGCALAALQTLTAGVYIAMNGRILRPERIRKNVEENRFEEI